MIKKFISYLIVFLMTIISLPLEVVFAEDTGLICSTSYEVTIVSSDGTYSNLSCTDNFTEAQSTMLAYNSTSSSVATIFAGTTIVDTEYGLLDLNTKSSLYNTYLYPTHSAASDGGYDYGTYTNGSYGTDAAFMGAAIGSSGSYTANMMISGYEGYVRSYDMSSRNNYNIVPLSLVKSPTYYIVSSGSLVHYLADDITITNSYVWHISIGVAPDYLQDGVKYYSYDGHYFYDSLLTLEQDYRNNTFNNSINSTEPFYNYYQYLSNRTKTTYTAEDIDDYITNVKGYTEKANTTAYTLYAYQSMMFDEGDNFIYAQDTFGVNALLTVGLAANESGWGRSSIARDKNNIFGHGAVDATPYGSAGIYTSVRNSILYHADYYIASGYCDTETDGRYYGCHFGNKDSGMNVKYASDPYWGEKMAANYYSIDKALGLNDYKSNKIGIKVTDDYVNVRKEATTSSDIIYKLNNTKNSIRISNMPVMILDEVTGESIDGNSIWYKIQTDATLDANRNALVSPSSYDPRPTYDWDNNYGYVHSSLILTDDSYIHTSSKFYFEGLTWNEDTDTMDLSGFIVARGTDNKASTNLAYSLILENVDTNEEYILSLDRWTENIPFTIPGENGYDYSGAWFKESVDLSTLPEGDYDATIRVRTIAYEATAVLRNIFGEEMSHKGEDDTGRGYQFRTNYYEKEMPLEIFIRENGLISTPETPNSTNMVNTYKDISFEGTSLNIRGNSYNIGVDYAENITVERQIVFENIETFERFSFEVGSITDGDHDIILRVPDGLSKTRAWFDGTMDLSSLPVGTYSIMIRTKAGTKEDAFELNDIFDRDLPANITIDDKTISLSLNKDKRYRIELTVQ